MRVQRQRAPDGRGRHRSRQVACVPRARRAVELPERHAGGALHRHAKSPEPAHIERSSARCEDSWRRRRKVPRHGAQGTSELSLSARARRIHAGRVLDALERRARGVRQVPRMAAPHGRRRPGRPGRRGDARAPLVSKRGLRGKDVSVPLKVLCCEGSRPSARGACGGGEPRARAGRLRERRLGAAARVRTHRLRRGAQP